MRDFDTLCSIISNATVMRRLAKDRIKVYWATAIQTDGDQIVPQLNWVTFEQYNHASAGFGDNEDPVEILLDSGDRAFLWYQVEAKYRSIYGDYA